VEIVQLIWTYLIINCIDKGEAFIIANRDMIFLSKTYLSKATKLMLLHNQCPATWVDSKHNLIKLQESRLGSVCIAPVNISLQVFLSNTWTGNTK